jgi:Tim17/Tim22/Tim23/Pmp24 family
MLTPSSFRDKALMIFKATRTHARNLGTFAFLYRLIMLALRHSPMPGSPSGKEAGIDSLLAGLTAGYAVFGRGIQSSVNQQIVTYVFARVVLALAKMAMTSESFLSPEAHQTVKSAAWPLFASVSWGMVMWLFRWYPDMLQPSLKSSMTYL